MTLDELSRLENTSIRAFVESCAEHFRGEVLDYGCGFQPYRGIIEDAGGEYSGWNDVTLPGCVGAPPSGPKNLFDRRWPTILCTQVLQYVPGPQMLLNVIHDHCDTLVLTAPTNWPEYSAGDLHRFTREGLARMLVGAGFVIDRLEERARVDVGDNPFVIGYAAVCTT